MSQAVFGFLGVFVGAVVTGLADYLLQKRRERVALRTARRMLLLELREARDFIEGSIDAMHWRAEPARVLSNEQWAEHRAVLAAAANEGEWDAVAEAFIGLARVRRSHLKADTGTALEPASDRVQDADTALVEVRSAIQVLEMASPTR